MPIGRNNMDNKLDDHILVIKYLVETKKESHWKIQEILWWTKEETELTRIWIFQDQGNYKQGSISESNFLDRKYGFTKGLGSRHCGPD